MEIHICSDQTIAGWSHVNRAFETATACLLVCEGNAHCGSAGVEMIPLEADLGGFQGRVSLLYCI